jgi:tetratricopeptide (TPR) repeat protein
MKLENNCLIFILLLLVACKNSNEPSPNALTESYLYESEDIGWAISIPAGYELVSSEELDERNEKGQEQIENTIGQDIEFTQSIDLLNFKFDDRNYFGSRLEPFFEEYPGEWAESNYFVQELIFATYENEGLDFISSDLIYESIGGQEFSTFYTLFYDEEGEIIMEQYGYLTLINENNFSVFITVTDEAIKDDMFNIWYGSTFNKVEDEQCEDRLYICLTNGDKAFKEDGFEQAKYWYLEALQIRPNNEYLAEQFEKCETQALIHLFDKKETNAEILTKRGHSEYILGDFVRAKEYYERALNADPENIIALDRIEKIKNQRGLFLPD